MARIFGFIIFIVLAVGGAWFLIERDALDRDGQTTLASDSDVDVMARQERAVRSIDRSVERAGDLAEQAYALAEELEKNADRAEESAQASAQLATYNDAADASVVASVEAADRARATAVIAREVSIMLAQAAEDAGEVTDEAGELTSVAVTVEKSQREAREAKAEAVEAAAKLEQAEEAVARATDDAQIFLAERDGTIAKDRRIASTYDNRGYAGTGRPDLVYEDDRNRYVTGNLADDDDSR
ncbi:hypothetical protein [Aquisalinus flavus]|uniref:Uncharacterized protein n=1 Tax=Aquisalinus flavus TaxID=1526572 RepID=A0A8J2V6U8_9PROT|nr:hypothetical protein [Aquisalinus flavus]MBD0426911.1 hypothetical protein [Aquisalinus flavus]UNE46754.1 hypothetical protein FF099_01090 [Aquisalinus flavus]GGC96914.1 hypothetical protein GCM10011342_02240 [Aquisalinus flavus]